MARVWWPLFLPRRFFCSSSSCSCCSCSCSPFLRSSSAPETSSFSFFFLEVLCCSFLEVGGGKGGFPPSLPLRRLRTRSGCSLSFSGCAVVVVFFVFENVFFFSVVVSSFLPRDNSGCFSSLFSSLFFNPTCRLLLETLTKEPLSSEADHEELLSSSSSSSSSEEKLSKYSFVSANSPSPPFLAAGAAVSRFFNCKYDLGGGGDDTAVIAAPAGANNCCCSTSSTLSLVLEVVCTVVCVAWWLWWWSFSWIFNLKISSRMCFIFFESSLLSRANSARSQLCATRIIDSDIDARWAKSLASFDSPLICCPRC